MGDEYYMGYLSLRKLSSFFKISLTNPETTYITIFVIIISETKVHTLIRDYKQGKAKTSPFLQLNYSQSYKLVTRGVCLGRPCRSFWALCVILL